MRPRVSRRSSIGAVRRSHGLDIVFFEVREHEAVDVPASPSSIRHPGGARFGKRLPSPMLRCLGRSSVCGR